VLPASEYIGAGTWNTEPNEAFNAVRGKPAQMIDYLLCKDPACSAYLEKVCNRFTLNVSDVRRSSKQLYNKLSQVAHGVSDQVAVRKREHSSMELAALGTLVEYTKTQYKFYDEHGLIVDPSPYKL
jgi:hypothetical protein